MNYNVTFPFGVCLPFEFQKRVTIDEVIDNFKYKENLNEIEFLDKLEDTLCTDWYKDYNNEFWTSNDPEIRDNAWSLTYKKAKNEFIKLRKKYCDEIIFLAIDISCKNRYDNIISVTRFCELIFKKLH